jgi:hypothetical protein
MSATAGCFAEVMPDDFQFSLTWWLFAARGTENNVSYEAASKVAPGTINKNLYRWINNSLLCFTQTPTNGRRLR